MKNGNDASNRNIEEDDDDGDYQDDINSDHVSVSSSIMAEIQRSMSFKARSQRSLRSSSSHGGNSRSDSRRKRHHSTSNASSSRQVSHSDQLQKRQSSRRQSSSQRSRRIEHAAASSENNEDTLNRILATQLRREWSLKSTENESLQRRLRDFKFAQQKRQEKYGTTRPWGILGLYDHLSSIRCDLEWAEDAAWRRDNGEPYLSWNDFDEDRDKGLNRPFFTYLLLIICTGTLIVSIALNGWKVEPLSINPMIGPSAETLLRMGAKDTDLIVHNDEWYRLFTPMFLHAGVIHYFLNMLALLFIGKAVEMTHGFTSALLLFVIPAVGGNILSALFLPAYISVGASGGIFGLIGACLADIIANWGLIFSKQVNSEDTSTFGRHVRVFMWLIVDIIVNCLVGLTPFVDNFTHLGGLCYGLLCGLSSLERASREFFGVYTGCCGHFRQFLIRFFGFILCVLSIFVTMLLLLRSDGVTSPCPSCRYISCFPFPFWKEEKWWYCDDCGQVVADARKGSSIYFTELSLTCPDGTVEDINITSELISDSAQLSKDLPEYCRTYCANTYA